MTLPARQEGVSLEKRTIAPRQETNDTPSQMSSGKGFWLDYEHLLGSTVGELKASERCGGSAFVAADIVAPTIPRE